MADKAETEIKRPNETIAQYLTIPRDIVKDSSYPFNADLDLQKAFIEIDKERNVLIVKPLKP